MNGLLKTGDRLVLSVPDQLSTHSRVRGTAEGGCLLVSYGGKTGLQRGAEVDVHSNDGGPKKIYYMQVKDAPSPGRPYVLLQRNPGARLNRRRRGWRVPFTAVTGIRGIRDLHFRGALFCDLSLSAARILSECQFTPGAKVMLRLNLPDYPEHEVAGAVLRASSTAISVDSYGQDMYGLVIAFESMSLTAQKHLTFFLWNLVRKTYPRQMRLLYDIGHRKQSGD